MFQSVNRKLHSGRTMLCVSAKNIRILNPSYSDHFNLSTIGVDPGHSTLWRIIFASDDTQKHITLRVIPPNVWLLRCRDLYFANMQYAHERDIHILGEILTRNPNKWAAPWSTYQPCWGLFLRIEGGYNLQLYYSFQISNVCRCRMLKCRFLNYKTSIDNL